MNNFANQDKSIELPGEDPRLIAMDKEEKILEDISRQYLPEAVFSDSQLTVWALSRDFTRIETAIEFAKWCKRHIRSMPYDRTDWQAFVDYKLKDK